MSFLGKLLGGLSGGGGLKLSDQLLFDKVIGFRSLVPGCGASTLVQNVAVALSEKTNYTICVLDTNFLYPIQYPLLAGVQDMDKSLPDMLGFAKEPSSVAVKTLFRNVYLVGIFNKGITTMLGAEDNNELLERVVGSLKSYFDVILVDLSNEPTNIATYAAIQCNKIIQVADTSLKSIYYVKKSLNTMCTLGAPLAKGNTVVFNKQLSDIVLGVEDALSKAGLTLLTSIPFSAEIARLGASGKVVWGTASTNKEVAQFNRAIDSICEVILVKTPLNESFGSTSTDIQSSDAQNVPETDEVETEGIEIEAPTDFEADEYDGLEVESEGVVASPEGEKGGDKDA